MRKFNLEEAKAGKPVVTRLGRPVRILCWDAKGSEPIVALIDFDYSSHVYTYDDTGVFDVSKDSEMDLFMKTEIKVGYIVLELNDAFLSGVNPSNYVYETFESACEVANRYHNRTVSKITWEA